MFLRRAHTHTHISIRAQTHKHTQTHAVFPMPNLIVMGKAALGSCESTLHDASTRARAFTLWRRGGEADTFPRRKSHRRRKCASCSYG